ncbi:hypothetical protein PG989_004668 [Apiospora arundinis]
MVGVGQGLFGVDCSADARVLELDGLESLDASVTASAANFFLGAYHGSERNAWKAEAAGFPPLRAMVDTLGYFQVRRGNRGAGYTKYLAALEEASAALPEEALAALL